MSAERIEGKPSQPLGPGFIPGVYNYCDRWCERCRFKARCVIAAMHVRLEEARARGEDLTKVDLPDVAPEPDEGIERPWLNEAFNQRLTDAELRDIDRREDERHRLMEADPLTLDAREYARIASRVATALEAELAGRGDPVVLAALDAIGRQALGISTKTWRAVGGQIRGMPDERDLDDDDGVQSDGNGSAKIARLMVAESRESWGVLMQVGRATANGLPVTMVARLDRLDRALAARFPRAMHFVRPGFDGEP
jgi:hypothetical protein